MLAYSLLMAGMFAFGYFFNSIPWNFYRLTFEGTLFGSSFLHSILIILLTYVAMFIPLYRIAKREQEMNVKFYKL